MKVLLTGATGYIGSAISRSLRSLGVVSLPLVRSKMSLSNSSRAIEFDLEDLSSFNWEIFKGFDVLIHTAALAHIPKGEGCSSLNKYRKINCAATLELAKFAINAGVKRFVFLSSIGVNGVGSDRPFTEKDEVVPHDEYSLSKYEAELGLLDIARNTEMEVVIIRPPLVYGPRAPGNFKTLVKWIRNSVPMPFGAINNLRSFIALDNLVDFTIFCSDKRRSPRAANEIFLISDGEDISTSEFLRKVAKSYKVKSRLISVPISWMQFAAKIFGKGYISDRLFGNLQVDSSKARGLLGWRPIISMDEQLEKIAAFDGVKKE